MNDRFAPVLAAVQERLEQRTQSGRLFHGRGHCYPGFEKLTVDLLNNSLVIRVFDEVFPEVSALAEVLAKQVDNIESVSVQYRKGRRIHSENLIGEVPEEIVFREDGLSYLVKPHLNQNMGFFFDMEPARQWLRQNAQEMRVLNLFAYTCSLSVSAIAAGALTVVNNDMSAPALKWGAVNHELNDHDLRKVSMLPHNLFKSWWKIRQLGGYDIVIIDPPTNQRGSFNAEKQYGQILKRVPEFLNANGWVIACLNSPFLPFHFLEDQMARWCPDCRLQQLMPSSKDFPDQYPDRGLKVGLFRKR